MSPNKPHHHGDLREALIEAGLALLAESGTEGLTLRRTAARAGVTHAAPAHHFDGLDGLRSAIAERGFGYLYKDLKDACDKAGTVDYDRLLALSLAYVNFSQENPGLFHLMFAQVKNGNEALKTAAESCYLLHQKVCAGVNHTYDKVAFEFAVWSSIHGYACLDMANFEPVNGAITAPNYSKVLNAIIAPPTAAE